MVLNDGCLQAQTGSSWGIRVVTESNGKYPNGSRTKKIGKVSNYGKLFNLSELRRCRNDQRGWIGQNWDNCPYYVKLDFQHDRSNFRAHWGQRTELS